MTEPPIDVPLFPLPSLVVFPGRLVPLRIFEPRYRAMTRDALAATRCFALAVLRPGWEPDYEGRPPIFEVVTLGTIVKHRALADGQSLLLVRGDARARVLAERSGKPYRIGRVERLCETPLPEADACSRRREIDGALVTLCGKPPIWPAGASSIGVVDELTLALPIPIDQRMAIHSTLDHGARIDTFLLAVRGVIRSRDEMDRAKRLSPDDLRLN